MSLPGRPYGQPPVYVTEADYERLANLAEANDTRGARRLADALDRAIIIKEGEFPQAFVRLKSRVAFTDLTTGRTHRVEVAAPDEADIDEDRLSVLTPVGSALIGLAAGQSIGLETDDGRAHVLVVIEVERDHATA
jgi:regulator of nucleoside diphosphate kinase